MGRRNKIAAYQYCRFYGLIKAEPYRVIINSKTDTNFDAQRIKTGVLLCQEGEKDVAARS